MSHAPKSIVTFSGGMDSTTLLYYLRNEGHEVMALGVDYGQRHRVELDYARRVANELNVPFEIADLSGIVRLLAGSSQTDSSIAVPLGHYAEDSMKQTVVPNRNMILLAVASAWAISQKADHVAYAAHAGDHTIYPDCRSEFADALANAIGLADWHKVDMIRPFVNKTKADIAAIGNSLGVPFQSTWSCYQGDDLHCGACGTCIERREAFLLAGVDDPTEYQDTAPWMSLDDQGNVTIDWTRDIYGEPLPQSQQHQVQSVA